MPSPKILIADHEPLIASLVAGILTQDGYETRTEQSSSDAIQNAGTFGPSLLVIDPIMPGLSGVEVAMRIARQTKCKVLFLTTLASDNDFREMVRGLRQQGCDCEALPKPFTKEQLVEHVHRRIGQAIIITDAAEASASNAASGQEALQPGSRSEHTVYTQQQGEYGALLNLSTPNLYQSNAFRITGLSVDSSLRDVSRATEKLEMMIKLGAVQPSDGIFPLPEQLSVPAVKSALQTLKDPEQRLLHEFFWFWPCSGATKDDLAIQALKERKYQSAVNVWANSRGQGAGIAVHNLAVFYHLTVLDGVVGRSKSATSTTVQDQESWASAYRYWKALSDRSDFWDSLTRRIRDINDPRLRIETAQRIWSSLPNAVLAINARLAIAAAEKGDFEEAGKQRRLMCSSAFGGEHAKKELTRGLSPLRDEIERLCENAETEARGNPKTAVAVVRRFLTDKAKFLQTFNYLLGVGDPICDAVHDRVAEAGRVCLVAYVNETSDWSTAQILFEECLALAEGKALRSKLEEDLEIIAGNIAAGRRSQPSASASTAAQAASTAPRSTTASQSARPTIARKRWSKRQVVGAFAVGIVILFAAIKGCEESPSPSEHTFQSAPTTSYPQPAPEQSEPLPATGTTSEPRSPQYSIDNSEAESLKAEIEADRATLSSLESQINQSRFVLDSLESQLRSDKAALDRMEREQNAGLDVDADEYERIRQRYNRNVDEYNVQVGAHNSKLAEYRQLLASANAKIDRYNSLGRSR